MIGLLLVLIFIFLLTMAIVSAMRHFKSGKCLFHKYEPTFKNKIITTFGKGCDSWEAISYEHKCVKCGDIIRSEDMFF